jgi:hypothetical protein
MNASTLVSRIDSLISPNAIAAIAAVSVFALVPMSAHAQFVGDDFSGSAGGSTKDFGYSVYDTPLSYDSYSAYDTPLSYDSYSVFDTPLSYDSYSVFDTPLDYNTYSVFDTPLDYNTYSVFDTPLSYSPQNYSAPCCNYHSTPITYSSRPVGFSMPSFTFNAPTSHPAPAPIVTTPTISTINNNTNNNTNINNITNNNNSSAIAIATVTPVAQTAPQYPVVYQQPPVVYQPPVYQPPVIVQPRPSCTISISNYNGGGYGQYGTQLATLSWSSSAATNGYISPNVGSVSGYGSMQVYPTSGQMYTMTVYGAGGSNTCSTQPYYVAMPVVTYNNPTPYVSLSQIPYTGIELDTLGSLLYWFSMVAFAGAAAYLVLYFNGGALATLGFRGRKNEIVMPTIALSHPVLAPVAVSTSTPVETHTEKPVVSPIQIARTATTDTMKLHTKAGEMPRITIARE